MTAFPLVDPAHFRQVLGQYPTGVVVVTAVTADGLPIGMTVGSFTSVSLDPPLVAFLPDKKSASWAALRGAGDRFAVNVLGADQEGICRAIATRKTDKFNGIGWEDSPLGNPVIDGSVAFIDCTVHAVVDAGDHDIVLGRVHHLSVVNNAYPLLFFRGGYGSFRPMSLAANDADLVDQLRLIDLARPHMEELAWELDIEVTAAALNVDEIVLATAAGRVNTAEVPTRVGQRAPFVPPIASVFAAFGGEAAEARWLANLPGAVSADQVAEYRTVPQRIRDRGYAIALGHGRGAHLETAVHPDRMPNGTRSERRKAIMSVAAGFNPPGLARDGVYELRSLSAPVIHPDGSLAFALTMWGPAGTVDGATVERYAARLTAVAARASASLQSYADAEGASAPSPLVRPAL